MDLQKDLSEILAEIPVYVLGVDGLYRILGEDVTKIN